MIGWSWTCVKVAAKDIGDATATTTTASKNETSIAIWRPLEAKVQSQLQLKLLLSTSSSHDVINDLKNGAGNGSSSFSSQCGIEISGKRWQYSAQFDTDSTLANGKIFCYFLHGLDWSTTDLCWQPQPCQSWSHLMEGRRSVSRSCKAKATRNRTYVRSYYATMT